MSRARGTVSGYLAHNGFWASRTLANFNAVLGQHRQEHHAIFDYDIPQKSRIFPLGAKRMNAGVADQRVK